MICQITGERLEKCRELVAVDASSHTRGVWWARSPDGREWVITLTPPGSGLDGSSDSVEMLMREISDRSTIPDILRRDFGLDE